MSDAGFYYSNLILPSGMSEGQTDTIIIDTLEQAIYGIWILSDLPNAFNANGFGVIFVFLSSPFTSDTKWILRYFH